MSLHPDRVTTLRSAGAPAGARYVLYWMQQSQRAAFNPALEFAVAKANELNLPVMVGFGLTAYPEANRRHYAFMLEGLREVERELRRRGIGFVVREGAPDEVALDLARQAALLICDRGYLALQRAWRNNVATRAQCAVVQVEGDVVVPVELVSDKHEYAARTLRPKIMRLLDDFLEPLEEEPVRVRADRLPPPGGLDLQDLGKILTELGLDASVPPTKRFRGGTGVARERFSRFLRDDLPGYSGKRKTPEADAGSHMSPYLHFGQVSPVELALAARAAKHAAPDDRVVFIEELVVRRELAINHVFYADDYAHYTSLPRWARETLAEHASDARPYVYGPAELEAGKTHDRAWNAAMAEMRATGYMQNHLRMYWGKKILEWSPSPQQAFATTLDLNNKYFLDGRDANSYANVGWIFGLHDRPWFRRPIFGTVRYMSGKSLEQKIDVDAYIATVGGMCAVEAA